ncbi:RluA family pseudouridine synthase [Akkermansiaceae bacterium]|nr:RluA family pseudouridine synthase [Akkermansiaceae bacterium]MDA9830115.1 RluA family pseudouridine synthase [Akkermansiaceae bacterium]MDB4382961.1 RluA family pseudouridine synthase [Akkermansiaceae bacterium]MDB4422371.1 RluA family pseudouridine synthase [bacterium]
MTLRIAARTNFEILEECEDWLIVEKPAPLIMHPTGKSDEVTLLGVLKEAMPALEFFFVNRLDRETSGCVLVAKNSGAARRLGKMMVRKEIKKEYEAIVWGWPEWQENCLTQPIRRKGEFEESEVWVRQAVHPEGKESETGFRVEGMFEKDGDRFSMIGCEPRTGRTHQIRVHLEYLGFPIVGDKIYGDEGRAYLEFLDNGWTEALNERLRLDRQALHARRMEFEWAGEVIVAHSRLPDELRAFCVA